MKRIVIDQFEGCKFHDLYFSNIEVEEEQEHAQGLSYEETCKKISELIKKYNMQPNHKIINNLFGNDEYLISREEMTVKEWSDTNE